MTDRAGLEDEEITEYCLLPFLSRLSVVPGDESGSLTMDLGTDTSTSLRCDVFRVLGPSTGFRSESEFVVILTV